MNEAILTYLKTAHHPHAILVYGSYADGTAGPASDFDALLICDEVPAAHDGRTVDGIPLDVFLHSTAEVLEPMDPSDYLAAYDAILVQDDRGMGAELKALVRSYVERFPAISAEKKRHWREWCEKMLYRAAQGDAEGYYRWHWVITDSLDIYCQLRDQFYFGPKKTLLRMARKDPEGHQLFLHAARQMDYAALSAWLSHVIAPSGS